MDERKLLPSAQEFLIDFPPYVKHRCAKSLWAAHLTSELRLDAYCVECEENSIFVAEAWEERKKLMHASGGQSLYGPCLLRLACSRRPNHKLALCLLGTLNITGAPNSNDAVHVEKIGQHPSYADLLQGSAKAFRKAFPTPNDAAEFNKAVGLAAHGVGIGSFVYLRRIFERLVQRRFDEFKQVEGWSIEEFDRSRMGERILMMRKHLPSFMVENSDVYSLLSVAIHALAEDECLAMARVLQKSILLILQEDEANRTRLLSVKEIEKELQQIRSHATKSES
jgi:hypothetical protein